MHKKALESVAALSPGASTSANASNAANNASTSSSPTSAVVPPKFVYGHPTSVSVSVDMKAQVRVATVELDASAAQQAFDQRLADYCKQNSSVGMSTQVSPELMILFVLEM